MRDRIILKDIKDAPNLQQLKDKFGVSEVDLIVAYGDVIYCPKEGMSYDLLEHELVHCDRQGLNERSAEQWWKRYIEDESFRLDEEIAAYHKQFKYCVKVYKDRNRQAKILSAMATELSDKRYGNICTYHDAMKFIHNGHRK